MPEKMKKKISRFIIPAKINEMGCRKTDNCINGSVFNLFYQVPGTDQFLNNQPLLIQHTFLYNGVQDC